MVSSAVWGKAPAARKYGTSGVRTVDVFLVSSMSSLSATFKRTNPDETITVAFSTYDVITLEQDTCTSVYIVYVSRGNPTLTRPDLNTCLGCRRKK